RPGHRGHALLEGPEAAVASAAAAFPAVLGAPRIGDLGARRFDAGGGETHGADRQSNQDTAHVGALPMIGCAQGHQRPAARLLHVNTHARAAAAAAAGASSPSAAPATPHLSPTTPPSPPPPPGFHHTPQRPLCPPPRGLPPGTGRTTDR